VSADFLLGTNYHPLDRERQSWSEWYALDPSADFQAMAEMGMSIVRVFFSWHMFEPQVGQYEDEVFERLDTLIAAAKRNGLAVILTLFDDDGTSELLTMSWRQGRDIVRDDYMLQRAIQVAQRVGTRYRGEKAILGFDVLGPAPAHELPKSERFGVWFASMVEALREAGAEQRVTVGADSEGLMEATGVRIDERLAAAGFRCSNVTPATMAYLTGDPSVTPRSTYVDAFLAKLGHRGAPVIANAVGVATMDETCEREADHLRVALASLFVNRAAAGLARRWRDLETEWRDPYGRMPFESPVGLHFTDGAERPAADEIRGVAELVAAVDAEGFSWEPERAAVIMPGERYASGDSLARMVSPRSTFAAFVTAKRSHIPVDVIVEGDPFDGYSLVIVPSVQAVEQGTWPQLASFVDAGGTALMSYGGGDVTQAFCELFGLEFMGDMGRRAGLATKPGQETVLGGIPALDTHVEFPHFALVSVSGAGIVATDTKGNPLLTVHSKGQGKAIFCAAPIERALSDVGAEAPVTLHAFARSLYRGAARLAGAGAAYECDSPALELAVRSGENGASDILIAINHDPYDVRAAIASERGVAKIADLLTGREAAVRTDKFVLPVLAHEVRALRLELMERRQRPR
jgi:endo-1,4-beta-mannosidase